jgi:hypothetical protein
MYIHDAQPYGPLSSTPTDFEYDILIDYQYGTLEQTLMEYVDDDLLFDTLSIELR